MRGVSQAIAQVYRGLLSHPQYRWLVIGGTLLYLISPIDLAPDMLPIFGQVDDVVLVYLLVNEAIRAITSYVQNQVGRAPEDEWSQSRAPEDDATQTVDVQAETID